MDKLKNHFIKDQMGKRLIMCVLGVTVCAMSVSFFKRAMLGVDPFQSLLAGLDLLVPISFGTLSMILNALFLVGGMLMDRHYVGIGTFMVLFLSGYVVDFSTNLLTKLLPDPNLPVRILCLIIGIVVMCIAAAFYTTADLGVSAYDQIALILANTLHWGPFRFVRIGTDFVCVALGVTLFFLAGGKFSGIGAVIGVGTIAAAFFMGPLIDLFNRKLAGPILREHKK